MVEIKTFNFVYCALSSFILLFSNFVVVSTFLLCLFLFGSFWLLIHMRNILVLRSSSFADDPGPHEKCCDICGDIGVSDAIQTCPQCKISCEHMSQFGTASRLRKSSQPNKQPCDLRQNGIDKKIPHGKVKYMHVEEVIMLSSGAKNSNSPIKSKSTCSTKPVSWKNGASALDRTPVKPKAIPAESSIHIVRVNPPFVTSKQLKAVRPNNSQLNTVPGQHVPQSFKGLRETGAIQASLKGQMQKEQPKDTFKDKGEIRVGKAITKAVSASSPATCGQASVNLETGPFQASLKGEMQKEQPKDTSKYKAETRVEKEIIKTVSASSPVACGQASVISGGDVFLNLELEKTDSRTADPIGIFPEVRKCSSGPALDATWKGRLKIYNDPEHGEMNGVQAYPPSRVLRKVYEFSKHMPEILGFELIPRGDLWPNLFQNYCLDRRDIGLYFFPSFIERCESYFSLLEAMEAGDLALRNLMDGVELLIFTSKVLSLDCQEWNGRHFLWGVFHSLKKAKRHACQVDGAYEIPGEWNSNQDIDMDVDMMAGEEVGRIDVAVPRASLQLVPLATDIIAASVAASDDMEIDMVGGEEVGKMDVIISRQCEEVLPLAVDPTNSSEAGIEIPPGFENKSRPVKIERPVQVLPLPANVADSGHNIMKNHLSNNFSKPAASQRLDTGSFQLPLNAKSEL
nr:uncharacterized protein LOC113741872 isoform X2 [Coffea arabica]